MRRCTKDARPTPSGHRRTTVWTLLRAAMCACMPQKWLFYRLRGSAIQRPLPRALDVRVKRRFYHQRRATFVDFVAASDMGAGAAVSASATWVARHHCDLCHNKRHVADDSFITVDMASDKPEALNPDSDEALMLAYGNGRASAFDILYQRHRGGVFRYLVRHIGSIELGEEIFQEVWMRLVSARERYTVKARFTTWLYHIAHNCLVDYYRRQKGGHDGLASDGDESMIATLPDEAVTDPERIIASQQALILLHDLLDALPAAQREAFLLREEGGLSVSEIADITGCNPEAAKSRLRYAVSRLRTGLIKGGVEFE